MSPPPALRGRNCRAAGVAAKDLVMGHAALTDLDTGRYRMSEPVLRTGPLLVSE